MHPGQVDVSLDMARELIAEQFPQWRDLAVHEVPGAGTVNAIFRVGEDLSARFPLVIDDVERVRHDLEREAAAARELLGRTRFRTPKPVALGRPSSAYAGYWAIHTWVPGEPATSDSSEELARDVAEFVRDVRALPTNGRTFSGTGRGGDLKAHDRWIELCLERSAGLLDTARLEQMWQRLRELPRESPDVMTHGDLIPGNVLVHRGRLTGVIDVGGLGPADPALDLVAAWHLFGQPARAAYRRHLEATDLDWERGKAWAFQQAMGAVWYYAGSNQAMSDMGRRTLTRLVADGRHLSDSRQTTTKHAQS